MDSESKLMPFFTDSKDFALGFEVGQVWTIMQREEPIEEKSVHRENKAQIEMVCVHFEYKYLFTDIDESWSLFSANKYEQPVAYQKGKV